MRVPEVWVKFPEKVVVPDHVFSVPPDIVNPEETVFEFMRLRVPVPERTNVPHENPYVLVSRTPWFRVRVVLIARFEARVTDHDDLLTENVDHSKAPAV